jgi:hypothetical protein
VKINQLIDKFYIYTSNEEVDLLRKMDKPMAISMLAEREKFVAESLIRKGLLTKIQMKDSIMLVVNDPEKIKRETC